MMYKLTLEKV